MLPMTSACDRAGLRNRLTAMRCSRITRQFHQGLGVRTIFTAIVIAFNVANVAAADASRRTIEVEVGGQRVQGTPLFSSNNRIDLLGRDGRLWSFAPRQATDLKQIGSSFQSYPTSVLKGRLQAELGKSFRIVSTGHYLVALPENMRTNWAERFEDLYRSFSLYFSVRGFQLREPEFPLVAIVWPDRESFLRAARAEGHALAAGLLGLYSPITNRIMLYDIGGGRGDADDWRQNAATLIHEATHQTAFNTGIHVRFADNPHWVVEGLGMMFEAPGVWNSRSYARREDRINRDRLEYFRKRLAPGHKPETLQDLISSDRMFSADTLAAYAEAWCLSFYLVETQPRKYSEYLALVARRPVGQKYTAAQRLADFTSIFGADFRMFEARFLRFISELR
jgi:hypothetical protein